MTLQHAIPISQLGRISCTTMTLANIRPNISPMAVFNMHQAKTALSRLVVMAQNGEEVIIARHNVAVARIVAVGSAPGKGSGKGAASGGFGEEAQMGLTEVDKLSGRTGGPATQAALKPRRPGALKGMFSLPDSFFDPLPEEELQAWEGESTFDPDRKP